MPPRLCCRTIGTSTTSATTLQYVDDPSHPVTATTLGFADDPSHPIAATPLTAALPPSETVVTPTLDVPTAILPPADTAASPTTTPEVLPNSSRGSKRSATKNSKVCSRCPMPIWPQFSSAQSPPKAPRRPLQSYLPPTPHRHSTASKSALVRRRPQPTLRLSTPSSKLTRTHHRPQRRRWNSRTDNKVKDRW